MQQKKSFFSALWHIMSGIVGGMLGAVVLTQMFTLRQHPLDVLLACMILGSFVGLIMSWFAKK